jgi:hypothetical protein
MGLAFTLDEGRTTRKEVEEMTTMMMERTSTGMQSMPGVGPAGMTSMSPATSNWLMVPRCTFKFEKTTVGMKISCVCDDQTARSMMQNLCTALMGGMCSCTCTLNGVMVCCCNFTMGLCKCELTSDGCSVTCTSGDQKCGEMIQSCCDCLATLCNGGCTCCLLMNNTPVCCGYSETSMKTTSKR